MFPDGAKVAELRGQRGLTQASLAHRSMSSLRTIQRIENGKSVKWRTLFKVAKALFVDLDALVATNDRKVSTRHHADGNYIRNLRKAHGWSQASLAHRSMCGLRTIQRMEAGGIIYLVTLSAVAKTLGVEPEKLILRPPPHSNNDIQEFQRFIAQSLSDSVDTSPEECLAAFRESQIH